MSEADSHFFTNRVRSGVYDLVCMIWCVLTLRPQISLQACLWVLIGPGYHSFQ